MSILCIKRLQVKEKILLVYIYVDDLICMGTYIVMIEDFKQNMKKIFEMSDLGLMSYFLGLEVKQDQSGIHVC